MPRTFICSTEHAEDHKWSVEESTAPEAIVYMPCPFHEDPQSYHEGPFQSPHLLLMENIEQLSAKVPFQEAQ